VSGGRERPCFGFEIWSVKRGACDAVENVRGAIESVRAVSPPGTTGVRTDRNALDTAGVRTDRYASGTTGMRTDGHALATAGNADADGLAH
jgi:hypothetical protein